MNHTSIFIGPRCPWGPIYGSGCLLVSLRPCADLTDVTLAAEDSNSILTDNADRALQGNMAMRLTQPGGLWQCSSLDCFSVLLTPDSVIKLCSKNTLLVCSHNVLLERVQSNLKLARRAAQQQQSCHVKTWQYCRNSNVVTMWNRYFAQFYCALKFRLRKLPISWSKYLAGCQEQRTVILR